MGDFLHRGLIERVALDRAHLHKCLLGGRVIVSNQLSASNRQLTWSAFQNLRKRSNQARQLDCFADLILGHAKEICHEFAGIILLAIFARSSSVVCFCQPLARIAKGTMPVNSWRISLV